MGVAMAQKLDLKELTIAEVLNKWPQTAKVFFLFNMACVGCNISPFCTIIDAANEYNMPLQTLLSELLAVIPDAGDAHGSGG
jgi:hybrid cluster-associated redox disulfide protein